MGRKPAARLTDIGSQHGGYPPTPIITGSDVTCNGRPIARQGDMLVPHTKPKSPPHPRSVAGGSANVLVNGKPWARQGDPINCGGKISGGSGDVLVGDAPKNRNPIEPAEWDEYLGKLAAPETAPRDTYERSALAAQVAVKYRGPEGAKATWHEHYLRQIGRQEPLPPETAVTDPAEREGLKRAKQEHKAEEAALRAAAASAAKAGDEPEPWPEYKKPANFNEALNRLNASQQRIRQHGYQPRYSDEALEQMAREPIDDSIIVRVMEMDYIKADDGDELLTGKLGRQLAGTQGIAYWTTTYKHAEDGDHLLQHQAAKLGFEPKPGKRYVMVMIDRAKAAEEMGSETFVPTFEKLGKFASDKFPEDLPQERVEAVMNEAYQDEYKRLMAAAQEKDGTGAKKYDLNTSQGLNDFAKAQGLSAEDKQKLEDRRFIEQSLGANDEFRGDGLTEELDKSTGKDLGAVESFTYDHDPDTLQSLHDKGIIHVHALI